MELAASRGDALIAACRDRSDGIRAMTALVPLLARSGAVAREDAAAALGCSEAELESALARLSFRVERDEHGRIVGAGVTSIPTPHRFRVFGHDTLRVVRARHAALPRGARRERPGGVVVRGER